ncbi:MAG TPA: hypothetical protein VEZ11_13330 [Thermoanaerobaculia bacterium]|nr:hypothetical protein [Thermoanaerobaculia bacterium]
MNKRLIVVAVVSLLALPLAAQSPIEMKLRITPVDTPTRRTDNNFQIAAASGFSVPQVTGLYNLYGMYGAYGQAWNHLGTNMVSITFPDPNNPDWFQCMGNAKPCDPNTPPSQRDVRCGDTTGLVWKTPLSSVPSWLYQNNDNGVATRIPTFAAAGSWPRQWPADCPSTGLAGWAPVISAAKINQAIPNPPHVGTPHTCSRDTTDPNSLATGAADTKVVYVNGKWYMGYSETINNPQNGAWTPSDLFSIGWATSNDGKNWTVSRQLFRSSLESVYCDGGLLLTQLTTDNNYFYMVADEMRGAGAILLRAAINQANPDGFDSWQIAAHDPMNPNHYNWVTAPVGGVIDTGALGAFSIMPTPSFVQQAAIARVYTSSAAGSPSRIIGVSKHDNPTLTSAVMDVWSAPDLDTPFTYQSTIDTAFIKPPGLNGWEYAFTYYPDQTPTTPRIIGNELDFWLIGDFSPNPGVPVDGGTKNLVAYRTTATVSGDIFAPRAALRTSSNTYISVTAGTVSATQTTIGLAARFVLFDSNGTLKNGDPVNLQARNGNYISATNGGGGTATATPSGPGTFETFTIIKTNGSGPIVNGDTVAFRSSGGYYLTARGGGSVDFTGTTLSSTTRFTYVAQ